MADDPVPTLKPGDVVRLKSGGPKMTVILVFESAINCMWFDQWISTFQTTAFPFSALEVVND